MDVKGFVFGQESFSRFSQSIITESNLCTLNISQTVWTVTALNNFFKYLGDANAKLKSLKIRKNKCLEKILAALCSNANVIHTIHSLDLGENVISKSSVDMLLSILGTAKPNLEKLNLDHCQFSDGFSGSILHLLTHSCLKSVDITGSNCSLKDAFVLLESISFSNICDLSLCISYAYMPHVQHLEFRNELLLMKNLQELNLSTVKAGEISNNFFIKLMLHNPVLKRITICKFIIDSFTTVAVLNSWTNAKSKFVIFQLCLLNPAGEVFKALPDFLIGFNHITEVNVEIDFAFQMKHCFFRFFEKLAELPNFSRLSLKLDSEVDHIVKYFTEFIGKYRILQELTLDFATKTSSAQLINLLNIIAERFFLSKFILQDVLIYSRNVYEIYLRLPQIKHLSEFCIDFLLPVINFNEVYIFVTYAELRRLKLINIYDDKVACKVFEILSKKQNLESLEIHTFAYGEKLLVGLRCLLKMNRLLENFSFDSPIEFSQFRSLFEILLSSNSNILSISFCITCFDPQIFFNLFFCLERNCSWKNIDIRILNVSKGIESCFKPTEQQRINFSVTFAAKSSGICPDCTDAKNEEKCTSTNHLYEYTIKIIRNPILV